MTRCRDEDRTENSRFIFPTCWERIVQYKTLAPAQASPRTHQSGSRDIFPRRGRGYGHCLDFGTRRRRDSGRFMVRELLARTQALE